MTRSGYMEQTVPLSPLMKDIYILVDSLVKLFPIGAHKHLTKLSSIGDQLDEYIKTYNQLTERFASEAKRESTVSRTLRVMEEKIVGLGRQLVVINSIELNGSKRQSISWLLALVLNTLRHSSSCDRLFSFIPDYFVEALISLFSLMRFHLPPTDADQRQKQDYPSLLGQFSSFVASHFCDQRITIPEIKDNLSQALASLVSSQETLKALESISFEERIKLVQSLCRPYENRAWAQTNWTLVSRSTLFSYSTICRSFFQSVALLEGLRIRSSVHKASERLQSIRLPH